MGSHDGQPAKDAAADQEDKMNLLDKYITAVGDHLPAKGRADIEAEIRSTLQDMLDDRSAATGQPIDDALISAVLKEYGAPAKVAATYQGAPRSLIGPRFYPMFELVLRIVLAVVVGASLLNLAVGMIGTPIGPEFGKALWGFFGQTVAGLVAAFGNVVLVFAVLERTLKDEDFGNTTQEWDPADLAKTPDPQAVKRVELIVEIVFTVIGLVVLNLYSNLLGVGFVVDGKWTFVPFLSEAFFRYLPIINVLSVLQIALKLIVLRQNVWQTWTRLFGLVLHAAGVVLAAVMLAGPSIVGISAQTVAGTPLAGHEGQVLSAVTFGVSIGLVVAVIAGSATVIRTVYKLITRRAPTGFPVLK
jgi:hypothetical protein